MASAILQTRNEPRSSDFMSKFTSNSFARLRNLPNPNPNYSQFLIGNNERDFLWKNHEQLPPCAPPGLAFICSSINSVPANSYGYRYITFRLGSYTRIELKQLKKRLISDLNRVRDLRHRVCSTQTPKLNFPAVLTGKERQKNAVGQNRSKPCCRPKKNVDKSKMVMKKCGQILTKLMKHKHGWVFNTPVDAASMKLYDYHNIIHKPMDLGTIKSNLSKNEYESPLAFASDVRLTFQNAMLYNGRGSNVFVMAERLLLLFEDLFNSTDQKLAVNKPKQQNLVVEKPIQIATVVFEQPTKPEMTTEEKSYLAESFENLQLRPEGIEQMMAILKKGSLGLERQGDEIELDLAVLDNDTLWELHGLIGRFRNEALTTDNMRVSAVQTYFFSEEGSKRDAEEEEDIDIAEELQVTNLPWLEIEKDSVSSGTSNSSSHSDSSSSDSGSGSFQGKA